jgi:hypothetical protein
MKFSEFQTLRSDVNGRTEVNDSMLRNDFCTAAVAPLAREVAIDRHEPPSLEQAFGEVSADSWETWGETMAHPYRVAKVSMMLMETMTPDLSGSNAALVFYQAAKGRAVFIGRSEVVQWVRAPAPYPCDPPLRVFSGNSRR